MNLPITIGKTSNSEILRVDLCELPHLFITYSEPEQLTIFYLDLIKNLLAETGSGKKQFALAVSKEMHVAINEVLIPELVTYQYIRNEEGTLASGSKYLFLQALMKELKARERKRMQQPGINKFPLMIILIDNIFDLVITTRKYTGLYFLQLLIAGKNCNMHFVAASVRTHYNLMKQLFSLQPNTTALLQKRMPGTDFSLAKPLGSELIINPEDLYFFKEKNQADYSRYFKIREGFTT